MEPILRKYGAAAVVRASQGEHGTLFVQGGSRTTAPDATPSVIIVAEQYNMLVHIIESGAPVQVRLALATKMEATDTNSYNVIAEIPGNDPVIGKEVVLIGAHLDSWHSATGATDNADAVSAAMEAMRILQTVGVKPRRTIRIAIWSGEEEGLLGSKAYADGHYDGAANTAARDALSVYFNDDPGTGPTYGFYMVNNPQAKAIFDAWLEPLKSQGAVKNVIGAITNTDHLSFTKYGIPAFTAIKDYDTYDVREHHTNADYAERVSEAGLRQSAIVLATFAYHAAMRNEKIPRTPLPSNSALKILHAMPDIFVVHGCAWITSANATGCRCSARPGQRRSGRVTRTRRNSTRRRAHSGMDTFIEALTDAIESVSYDSASASTTKPVVFGYSMGGYVTLALEAQQPGTLGAIITLGTKFAWTPEVAAHACARLDPRMIEEKIPKFAATLAERHAACGGWMDVLANTRELLTSLGANPRLAQQSLAHVSIPVCIAVGERDDTVGTAESAEVAAWMPRATSAILAGTPHPIERVATGDIVLLVRKTINIIPVSPA